MQECQALQAAGVGPRIPLWSFRHPEDGTRPGILHMHVHRLLSRSNTAAKINHDATVSSAHGSTTSAPFTRTSDSASMTPTRPARRLMDYPPRGGHQTRPPCSRARRSRIGPWQPRWRGCQQQPRSWHWHVRRCAGSGLRRACRATCSRTSDRAAEPLSGRLPWAHCWHTSTGPPGCGQSSTIQVRRTLGWAERNSMARAFLPSLTVPAMAGLESGAHGSADLCPGCRSVDR